uniref:anthranilate synthase n=2 Tax=Ignisphaera aggregans TaxID=334771 RepID=A0A832AXU3_9CREN
MKHMPNIEDAIKCINGEEEVFAVYEDLAQKSYSVIVWGVKNIVKGSHEGVLDELRTSLKKVKIRNHIYPLDIGLIGYVGYDAIRLWEKIPDIRPYPEEWDYVEFFEPMNIAIYDYSKGSIYIDGDPHRLEKCGSRYSRENVRVEFYDSSLDGKRFEEAVEEVLKYIRNGYVFQVVLSRFQRYTYGGDVVDLYLNLREINPSPYTYFIKFSKRIVLGASPELLYSYRKGIVETYPIAGTRPRGRTVDEDKVFEEELLKSEKDRAEHLMLVDLARNDLGKVCVSGTVKVEKLMYIEKYSHVQHMVSKVVGIVKKRYDSIDLMKALLPAGTVSGAPKPFAMKLIEELEEYKRGPYAGAVGFFTSSGEAVMAIAIRSAFIYKDLVRIQAGAGIVYDSKPRMEYEETEHKLAALKVALGVIER